MTDHTNQSRRYPAITADNIVKGIAVGANTPTALAQMFGFDFGRDLLCIDLVNLLNQMSTQGRIRVDANDARTLHVGAEGRAV